MIGELKPYSAMKDSGVRWLGEVPKHWETERAKWLFRKMERPVRESHEVVTCFRDGVVTLRKYRRLRGFTESLKEFGYQGISRGDLVIHAMDAFAGAAGVSESDGKGTSVYSVCSPSMEGVNAHYYAFCVREMARSQWILALSKGIRERSTDFRFSVFAAQVIPLPPVHEQNIIVRFLDYADRRIRRYIRAKEKLIALLEEQKQAIIHQAVTGQIDVRTGQPYPAYKPSGVDWLGEVPAHWDVVKLSHWFRCTSGSTPSRNAPGYYSGDILWVKTGELLDAEIHQADENITQDAVKASSLTLLPKNTLLIAMYGQGRTRGRTGLLKVEATVNQACLAILPNVERACPEYLQLWFVSQYLRLRYISEARNATQPNLNAEIIKSQKIAIPPNAEQKPIMESVRIETETVENAIGRANREISLLNEYHHRLIADVVTGKLDVREAAVALPEVDPLAADDELDEPVNVDAEADSDELDAMPEEVEA